MVRVFWCGIILFGVVLLLLSGEKGFSKPLIFSRTEVQELTVTEKSENQKALDDLGETRYVVYRIAERIIRANKLEQYPWRIYFDLKPEEINASSGSANLITLETGLADSFNNDYSALAFVISHEMSHTMLFHDNHSQDEVDLYNKQIEDAKKRLQAMQFKLQEDCFDTPGIYRQGLIYRIIANRILKRRHEDVINLHNQVKIEQDNIKRAEDNLRAFLRQQESAADRLGVILMVRAGFDPAGIKRHFDFSARLPFPKDITMADHPSNAQRMLDINTQLVHMNINQLVEEGKSNLSKSKILNYKKSIDDKSFIINANSPSNNTFDFFNDTKPSKSR